MMCVDKSVLLMNDRNGLRELKSSVPDTDSPISTVIFSSINQYANVLRKV